MKNKQKNDLIGKVLKLTIATIFSFSLVNSTLIAKFTDINEFGSVAFAKKSKEEKASKESAKAEKAADKAAEKASKEAEKAAEKASKEAEKAEEKASKEAKKAEEKSSKEA